MRLRNRDSTGKRAWKSLESAKSLPKDFQKTAKRPAGGIMNGQVKHLYEFGPFQLDATERQLLREGEIVALTPKVFDLLLVLVQNSGHTVEKNELLKRVWP